MSDMYDRRSPRRQPPGGDGPQKRSLAIKLGVVGAGLLGGYGAMSLGRSCTAPPDRNSADVQHLNAEEYQKLQTEYEQCRRRRSSSTTSRSGSRSLFSSSGSSRSSISRGGFGRSGSFGG